MRKSWLNLRAADGDGRSADGDSGSTIIPNAPEITPSNPSVTESIGQKSPAMEAFLQKFVKEQFGSTRDGSQCAICKSKKVNRTDFRDDLSWREFQISKMCQECQDKTFGAGE